MRYIFCPDCKKKISERMLFTNANARRRVSFNCPSCLRSLKMTLKGNTAEQFDLFFHELIAPHTEALGYLRVVENQFTHPALLPLVEGDNLIGRDNGKGTTASVSVFTADPSMDRNHMVITVLPDGAAILKDNDSMTGTFLNGVEILLPETAELHTGDTLTLGATTLIYYDVDTIENE